MRVATRFWYGIVNKDSFYIFWNYNLSLFSDKSQAPPGASICVQDPSPSPCPPPPPSPDRFHSESWCVFYFLLDVLGDFEFAFNISPQASYNLPLLPMLLSSLLFTLPNKGRQMRHTIPNRFMSVGDILTINLQKSNIFATSTSNCCEFNRQSKRLFGKLNVYILSSFIVLMTVRGKSVLLCRICLCTGSNIEESK